MKANATKCPAEFTLALISGRWKIPIVFRLLAGRRRFSELARALTGVTQKVLTQRLREMERNGLVTRSIYPRVPPKVEYALTELGASLKPVVQAMCRWGEAQGVRRDVAQAGR